MDVESAIRVCGLRKVYAGRLVLDSVDLEVRAGEGVALLGPNGAGKTTLLRVLATLVRPTRGEASVAGFDCARQAEGVRAHLGFVAHGTWVYEDLTALENLRFWATLAGQAGDAETLTEALAAVELDHVAGERARTFSAGMKRRLSLARVALGRPAVLLLDEPFAGLDQRGAKWLETHLAAVKVAGTAVLFSTHSFSRGLGAADRIAVLVQGRVALDTPLGTMGPEDVRRLYETHAEDAL
jgi:heme exporter protein A